jgi:hypothetical protein
VGRITVAFGNVNAEGAQGKRNLAVASPLFNGDRITVAEQAAATLLLDTRVVTNLNGGTVLKLVEQRGKTELQLERGQAEVFVGLRPPDLGPVALVDPESEIETTGTVFFASYSAQARLGSYGCEENVIKLRTRGGQTVTVPAGQLARPRRRVSRTGAVRPQPHASPGQFPAPQEPSGAPRHARFTTAAGGPVGAPDRRFRVRLARVHAAAVAAVGGFAHRAVRGPAR